MRFYHHVIVPIKSSNIDDILEALDSFKRAYGFVKSDVVFFLSAIGGKELRESDFDHEYDESGPEDQLYLKIRWSTYMKESNEEG